MQKLKGPVRSQNENIDENINIKEKPSKTLYFLASLQVFILYLQIGVALTPLQRSFYNSQRPLQEAAQLLKLQRTPDPDCWVLTPN